MNKPKKIITHDGIFHADEIFACALILEVLGSDIPIERTRDIKEEDINDPDVWLIDVGGEYHPSKKLFDHHQDANFPASNVMVLTYLYTEQIISYTLFRELRKDFKNISEIDKNGYDDFNGFQVNSFFKNFNAFKDEDHTNLGFTIALGVAKLYIQAKKINESVRIESDEIYRTKSKKICSIARVCSEHPVFWKDNEDGVEFIVSPNLNGEWCLHSRSSKEYPIRPTGDEKFLHKSNHFAIYNDKEDAVQALIKQCGEHNG